MKLSQSQTDEKTLTRLGEEAVALVKTRNFSALAERFGYALSYGRSPAKAIEEDLAQCLSKIEGGSGQSPESIKVQYFQPNSVPLYAAVECITPISQSATLLVELVVTGIGEEKHITLEQISNVT